MKYRVGQLSPPSLAMGTVFSLYGLLHTGLGTPISGLWLKSFGVCLSLEEKWGILGLCTTSLTESRDYQDHLPSGLFQARHQESKRGGRAPKSCTWKHGAGARRDR